MSNYCKECEKPLPQNSKTDICENCQNKKNKKTRKILEGVVGLVVSAGLFVITQGRLSGSKK
jgi:uncharacterized paraquat-inducible protein A